MKLEDRLRQGLLGHLSEANTVVDITIAGNITREFSIDFSVFVARNYRHIGQNKWTRYLTDDVYTTEEILKIYENGL